MLIIVGIILLLIVVSLYGNSESCKNNLKKSKHSNKVAPVVLEDSSYTINDTGVEIRYKHNAYRNKECDLGKIAFNKLIGANIFNKALIRESKELLIEHGRNFRSIEPLITNEERKELGIKFRGKLSKKFIELLNNNEDYNQSIEAYNQIIKDSQEVVNENSYYNDRLRVIKLAKKNRKEDLKTAEEISTYSVKWRYSDNTGACNHAHLNDKDFDLRIGCYDPNEDYYIYPTESVECFCWYRFNI